MISSGFAGSFIGVAAYLLIRNPPLAIMAGCIIGIPTGVGASSGKSFFNATARVVGIWAALLGAITAYLCIERGLPEIPELAFLVTLLSTVALCAGCSQILRRELLPADDQSPRFQFSLAEALSLSVLFGICLGSAIWWKRLAPELFEILANPGIHLSQSV